MYTFYKIYCKFHVGIYMRPPEKEPTGVKSHPRNIRDEAALANPIKVLVQVLER